MKSTLSRSCFARRIRFWRSGGAIGFIGLFCQKRIGIQQYFAFEANPETLGILRRNYELNTLTPAAWNLALARCDGPLDLEGGE